MDDLDAPREAVANAIAKLKAYSGTAGSTEMRQVQNALDYCGYAYLSLQGYDGNPAWSSD